MAQELNMHFSSVFTREDTSSLPIFVMDRDEWSGKSIIINILLPFHICV